MESCKLSKALMRRLPLYLTHLKSLPGEDRNVSATSIANALGLGDVQVRKDLAKISNAGLRRVGRSRDQLIHDIEAYLGFASQSGTIIIGAGKLGQTLLDYGGFETSGLNVLAAFDLHPVADRSASGKAIYPMSLLESFCKHNNVHVGIIAVPPESAQSVCDRLIACGIRAIWNFAPVPLTVPSHVIVQNEDLAASLATLCLHMQHRQKKLEIV